MVALHAEDFDTGPGGEVLTTANTGATFVTGEPVFVSPGKQGTYCGRFATDSSAVAYARWDWAATGTGWAGFFLRLNATPAATYTVGWVGGGGTKIADLRINADRTLTVRDQSAVAITSTAIPLNTWVWVTWRVRPGASAGLRLRLWLPAAQGTTTPSFDQSAPSTSSLTTTTALRIGDTTLASVINFDVDRLRIDDTDEPSQAGSTGGGDTGTTDPGTGTSVPLLYEEHFDGGPGTVAGDQVTTSNTTFTATAGTPMTFATGAREGAFCARSVVTTTQTAYLTKDHSPLTHVWYVFNYLPTGHPAAATAIANWYNVTATTSTLIGQVRHWPDGTLELRDVFNGVARSTVPVSTTAWNRIAIRVDPTSATGHEIRLYDAVNPTPVYTGTGTATGASGIATATRFRLGVTSSGAALDVKYDYFRVSDNAEPGSVAATELFAEGFEGVTSGTAVTSSNTGLTSALGTVVGTTDAYEGARAARINVTNATGYMTKMLIDPQQSVWHGGYSKVAAFPSGAFPLGQWFAGTTKVGDMRITANGKVQLRDEAGNVLGVTTQAVTAGQWFRWAVRVQPGNTTDGHRARLYFGSARDGATPTEELSGAAPVADALTELRWGVPQSVTVDLTIDRLRVGVSEPGPLGGVDIPGPVTGVVPTVNAGVDQTVDAFDLVTLVGAATPPSGRTITSRTWRVISSTSGAPAVTLSSTAADTITFRSPGLTTDVIYTLGYTATDSTGAVAVEDEVSVTVLAATTLRARGGVWVPMNVTVARGLVWDAGDRAPMTGPTASLVLTRVDNDSVTANWAGSVAGTAAITTATVAWGDGTSSPYTWPGTKAANHDYPATPTGPRTVTVTLTDASGLTRSASAQFTVQSTTGPSVTMTLTRVDVNTVTASVTATAGTAALATRVIAWGDGTSTTLTTGVTTAQHTFPASPAGLRTVTVTVTDTAGLTASDTKTFDVQAGQIDTTLAIIYAAGDIATATAKTSDERTSDLIINRADGDYVLALGDLQYPDGARADFDAYYAPSWGRAAVKNITLPVPGNHEYHTTPYAAGYRSYWGAKAIPNGSGTSGGTTYYKMWRRTDIGNWVLLGLDSELVLGGYTSDEGTITEAMEQEQITWLTAQLQSVAGTRKGVLAYWHRPRYSSSVVHLSTANGSTDNPNQFTNLLVDYKADVVLTGHAHNYERFQRMGKTANTLTGGVRHFVIGTGGNSGPNYTASSPRETGSQVYIGPEQYGVLRMELSATGYTWQFLYASGSTGPAESGSDTINQK